MGGHPGFPPSNWMWAAIVSLFVCLPLGIIGLIFSMQVNSKWHMGDYAGAHSAANTAKICGLIGVIGGVIIWGFYGCSVIFYDPYYYY